ncbi:hypothetical protein JXB31_02915, partial [Candidatus Woesearchaeota archaeon]|nr:hypothetical protein [Candidatus Woesearchaeota archaeon]
MKKDILFAIIILVFLIPPCLALVDEDNDFYLEDTDLDPNHPSYDHCPGTATADAAAVDSNGCSCVQK